MKILRNMMIIALAYSGTPAIAMQKIDMEQEINALSAHEIVNRLPESLFADLPKPVSPFSAEDIIKNQDKIKQRYLTLKEKLERYGCTLPYYADHETTPEKHLTQALSNLDEYYGQFIQKIKQNGADASFLKQARRLNINDANASGVLDQAGISSKWALVEAINSTHYDDLLTLPLQAILQDYMKQAPSRTTGIQRALDRLERKQDDLKCEKRKRDELKRKQDELNHKAMDIIKEKIAYTQRQIERYHRFLEKNKLVLSSSTDLQSLQDAQDAIDRDTENLQSATRELQKLENELQIYQAKI